MAEAQGGKNEDKNDRGVFPFDFVYHGVWFPFVFELRISV